MTFVVRRLLLPVVLALGIAGCVAYDGGYAYGGGYGGGYGYHGGGHYAAPAYVAPSYVAPSYVTPAPRYRGGWRGGYHHAPRPYNHYRRW